MYLAESPSQAVLEEYYDRYSTQVKSALQDIISGKVIDYTPKNSSFIFHCKLIEGSSAMSFFKKYIEEDNLKCLLIGDFDTLLMILDEVKSIDSKFYKTASRTKYSLKSTRVTECDVEDLNIIFKTIFVDEIYNDTTSFDKTHLAELKNQHVCPYCGATSVERHQGTHHNVDSYEIEHYLPKSKFPFFALSYYNLFPACEHCNKLMSKGSKDPINIDTKAQFLMHPNKFEDEALTFIVSYNGKGVFSHNNFSISVDYHGNTNLEYGYNNIIAIENLYKVKTHEVERIWNLLSGRNKDYYKYIRYFGFDYDRDEYISTLNVLGYEESLENSRRYEMYKFQTEVFHQLQEFIPIN